MQCMRCSITIRKRLIEPNIRFISTKQKDTCLHYDSSLPNLNALLAWTFKSSTHENQAKMRVIIAVLISPTCAKYRSDTNYMPRQHIHIII